MKWGITHILRHRESNIYISQVILALQCKTYAELKRLTMHRVIGLITVGDTILFHVIGNAEYFHMKLSLFYTVLYEQ